MKSVISTQGLPSVYALTRPALASFLSGSLGPKESIATSLRRAEALFKSLYRALSDSPESSIRRSSFNALVSAYSLALPVRIESFERSEADGAIKFIVALESDGLQVETVLIPERGRLTQCLSTQVGCAQGCRFCQTGRMGLARSLTVEEIVGQVLAIALWMRAHPELSPAPRVTNVVFMGMGEPLDNLDALLGALAILLDEKGLALSPNKVTVSTVGLLPQLSEFLSRSNASLALSLHSPFDAERSRVMPVNQRHPIADVLAVLREHAQTSGRRYLVQYTLIRNVNDSLAHADAIASLLEGMNAKVNLIPLNEHEGTAYRRPGVGSVYDFQKLLKERGLVATVRLSKGRDIQAACGQLIQEKKRAQRTSAAETESPTL